MTFLKRVKPLYFFISFAIGLFVVYVFSPPPTVVIKFPSPQNAGHVLYKDSADTCFMYNAEKVACPRDHELVKPQPVSV